MLGVLGGSSGGVRFVMGEVPLYGQTAGAHIYMAWDVMPLSILYMSTTPFQNSAPARAIIGP